MKVVISAMALAAALALPLYAPAAAAEEAPAAAFVDDDNVDAADAGECTTAACKALMSGALDDLPQGSNAGSCDTVLCMAGMVMGKSGGSACKGPVNDFFKIVKFKDGDFSPSRTSRARSSFLNKCGEAPGDVKSGIIGKFGRLFSL